MACLRRRSAGRQLIDLFSYDPPEFQLLRDHDVCYLNKIKQNVSINWTIKETVRAKMRVLVKKILRKYGYPRDLQEAAITTVLEQVEALSADWAS
jgi:hypothetical protein